MLGGGCPKTRVKTEAAACGKKTTTVNWASFQNSGGGGGGLRGCCPMMSQLLQRPMLLLPRMGASHITLLLQAQRQAQACQQHGVEAILVISLFGF